MTPSSAALSARGCGRCCVELTDGISEGRYVGPEGDTPGMMTMVTREEERRHWPTCWCCCWSLEEWIWQEGRERNHDSDQ